MMVTARPKLSPYLTYILLAIIYLCFIIPNTFGQTTYTWNGSNSSAWNDNLNWTPNTGFPLAADDAVITSSGFSPVLDATRSITNLTLSSGTFDLNTFILTITGTATFTSGNVNNGTISPAGTSASFGGTTFGANVSANCATILLNGSTFNGITTIEKNGAANNTCTGNNTFNGATTIINSGTGWIRLSNTTRDIFNGDVTFTNTGTSLIYPAYNDATGTQFNGNIVVNCTAGTGIYFGQGSGIATLAATKTITVGGTGFTIGSLRLRNFTQTGATSQALTLTGTAVLYFQTGTTFNGDVTVASPQLYLNGTTFNSITTLEKNGATDNAGIGGNTFNNTTTIINSGTGYLLSTNTTADIYNADVTFTATNTGRIISVQNGVNTQFNGNIIVNSTAGGSVEIGNSTGTSTLAAGKTISIGGSGFSNGTLELRNFTQTGATAQSFILTGTSILQLGSGSTFNGNVNFTSPQLYLNGCTFNGTATLEKSGATNNASAGNNTFNGTTTITNSGSGYIYLSNTTRDLFNADVTFTSTGSNLIYPAYNDVTGTQFNGNIILNSTGASTGIRFGQGTGTATLANTKTISIGGSGFSSGNLYIRNFTQVGATAQSMTTFSGTVIVYLQTGNTFNGNVTFTAPQLYLNGTTFNGTATLEQTGATNTNCTGGNTFNGVTTITTSGSGYLSLAYTNPDVFNENIIVNNPGGGGVRFGQNTGTATLAATKTITIGGGGFTAGNLMFRNFTQTGATAQNFTLTGTAILYFQTGTTFNGDISAVSPQLFLNGTTFNGVATLEKNGATNNAGIGGNTFNGITTIINSGSGYLMTGNGTGDNFNADVTFTNTGAGIYVAYATGATAFNGNIIINSTGTVGVQFGQAGAGTGSSTLAAGKTISIGGSGFSGTGTLLLRSFTQTGATAQSLALTGTAILTIGPSSSFGGNVTFTAPQLYLNGCTYSGTATLEKNGATDNASTGGNIFNGITTITNSGSGYVRLSNTTYDIFNSDVTFTNSGSNLINVAYTDAVNPTQFNGNIILNSTGSSTGIRFGQNTGTATLANTKTISIGGSGFSSGNLYIRNFTQTGATAQTMTTFAGTVALYLQTGNTFNGNVSFTAPQLYLNGTTFNGTATLEKSGATNNNGVGGNTFNGATIITNSGSGYLRLSNTTRDIFNADVTFTSSGSNLIYVAQNDATGTQFNGNVILNSTGTSTGIRFGQGTGTATLANTKTISIGGIGFSSGNLYLRNFTQTGATAQTMTTFSGTVALYLQTGNTFNGNVTFTAPQLYLNGTTYNGTAVLEKSGATNNAGAGGNTFNGVTTIANSGSGYLMLGNGNTDNYNADITFTNTGSNYIYVAYATAAATFNGNIIVNSTGSSLGVLFGSTTGTATLANTKTISVGGSGFSTGTLLLRNFTQTGATAQALTLTGTAILTVGTASTFNGNVNFTSPQLFLNGCTYNGTATLEKNGATNNQSAGGNTFNGTTTITCSGSGYILLANSTRDIFNADVTFTNTGSNLIYPAYNDATGTQFNGNIILNSTGTSTGIRFGQNTGTATLANTKTITIGGSGFSSGNLYIRNFTQTGATAQTMITFAGTVALYLQSGNTFNGDVTFTAPQLFLNGTTFNGTATLEKNGATNNTSTGANIFNATATIKNSGTGIMYLANTTADDFNSSATFIQTGAGTLYPAYNTNCTFSGDISTVGTVTAITFAQAAGGRITIDGNGVQNFNGASAQKPVVRRMSMTTSGGGTLTLNVLVDINIDLTMTTGNIVTTSVNLLTLTDESVTTTVGSAGSYIDGPMAYIMSLNGTSTLNFPVGKGGDWRPVVLTPTHNAATAYTYTSEVINSSAAALGYTLPGTVDKVSSVRYWQIDRTPSINANLTGATARLYYGSTGNGDGVTDYTNLTVCKTNGAGTAWLDAGGTATANNDGNIISNSFTSFSRFTLGNLNGGANPLPIELISFDAKMIDNGEVNTTWITATETNNDYFTIEKSTDALHFEIVGKVKGAGNSTVPHNYSLIDKNPYSSISYYRLKQTDFDGKFTYSDLVAVESSEKFDFNVFPNPTTNGDINLSIVGNENDEVLIIVNDLLGRNFYSKIFILNDNGNAIIALDKLENLVPGVYNIFATNNEKLYNRRIVIR